jgi:hypothetical protein
MSVLAAISPFKAALPRRIADKRLTTRHGLLPRWEGGFNEKIGANERSIEIYDHRPQLRWDTQRFRIRRHDCCALGPCRSVANIIMLDLNQVALKQLCGRQKI